MEENPCKQKCVTGLFTESVGDSDSLELGASNGKRSKGNKASKEGTIFI
jgi:hypothetical protein